MALVDTAATLGQELARAADAVLEHYVHQAHQAGYSWVAIGARLGVSRQAARQRFGLGDLQAQSDALVLMPRLQACLDRARAEAERDGRLVTDTQYLVLGLLHAGVAAAALDRLGVTTDDVRAAIRVLFDPPEGASAGQAPFSYEAQHAIDGADSIARARGHGYVGTEHLLFCLVSDPGSQARRVLHHLGVDATAVTRELRGFVGRRPHRGQRQRRPLRAS